MKKKIIGILVSLAVTSTLAVDTKKVYAVVNGDEITSQSIAIALKNPQVQFDTLPKDKQKDILNRLVEQKLLSQNAIKTDAIKDPIYIETLRNLKQDLALQVWVQNQSKAIKITDKEMKKFYDNNKQLFKIKAQLKARHILLKDKETAQKLISILNKSTDLKSKFIQLAKEKSTGPSGANGGDLGWFELEAMVPNFSNSANKLKVNSITQNPVKTQFGYHIIYLEDKKIASTIKFEDAKFDIRQKIGQEELIRTIQTLVNKLKKEAKIQYK